MYVYFYTVNRQNARAISLFIIIRYQDRWNVQQSNSSNYKILWHILWILRLNTTSILTNLKDLFPDSAIQMHSFRLVTNVVFPEDSHHTYFIIHTTEQQENKILMKIRFEFD